MAAGSLPISTCGKTTPIFIEPSPVAERVAEDRVELRGPDRPRRAGQEPRLLEGALDERGDVALAVPDGPEPVGDPDVAHERHQRAGQGLPALALGQVPGRDPEQLGGPQMPFRRCRIAEA